MIRRRPRRWTEPEHQRLLQGRSNGETYRRIALDVGHSEESCRVVFNRLIIKGRRLPEPTERRAPKAVVKIRRVPKPPPEPVAIDHARPSMALARLQADAELRNRIATMGITAGLFGDPPPGRSALDRKLAETST